MLKALGLGEMWECTSFFKNKYIVSKNQKLHWIRYGSERNIR